MRKLTAWLHYPRTEVLDLETYLGYLRTGTLTPGLSPKGAAAYLGIRREGLSQYARRGTIGAYVVQDEDGEVTIIDIPLHELDSVPRRRRPSSDAA